MKKIFIIRGDRLSFEVEVPIETNGVCTNEFCPDQLLTGGIGLLRPINGESEEEFIEDCRRQIVGMEKTEGDYNCLDRHIAGLMAVVMDHIASCGRLIFGDLLIYIDVFSILLKTAGFDDAEIREIYPRVARSIVDLYPKLVLNTIDLTPFHGSVFDLILDSLISCREKSRKV